MQYKSEFELAMKAARQAGELLRDFDPCYVDSEQGRDIKLRADREAEALILDCLSPSGLPVLSEENGESGVYTGGLRWIVDPLDGSFNFFKRMPELCCTSIALWDGDKPVLGVIYRFHLEEMLTGLEGIGAWINGQPMHPSHVSSIEEACCTTGLSVKRDFSHDLLERYVILISKSKKVRMLGTAAIMCSNVAYGPADIYYEEDIMLWDVAAAIAIVDAAGGVTEYRPKPDGFCCNVACFANEAIQKSFHQFLDRGKS